MKFSLVLVFALVAVVGCNTKKVTVEVGPSDLHKAMQQITDVIIHDIFSPPVASRIYTYSSIAAYEIMAQKDSTYRSLAGQINGLTPLPEAPKGVNFELAAVEAMLIVGKQLIFSEEKIAAYQDAWHQSLLDQGMSESELQASIDYANTVKAHIMAWSDTDNYKQTRTFEKFTVKNEPSRWQPTPPAYMEAIEPHWNKIRTFVIDSPQQFMPPPPTEFNTEEGSTFFQEMKAVYEAGLSLTEEQAEIAQFWDCNPYKMNVHGHVMFATKKITPGGHWMGIAKIASQVANANMSKSAAAYALTSLALADGFIVCWDEKYRSNLIRPETVINKYLDEEWLPLLQTPPFPEYTSGHSVISGAAAVALTSIYGEPFHFADSTELKFGLPVREFDSFKAASDEAAISRFYGGIHYIPAIENGIVQGRALGRHLVEKVQLTEK